MKLLLKVKKNCIEIHQNLCYKSLASNYNSFSLIESILSFTSGAVISLHAKFEPD